MGHAMHQSKSYIGECLCGNVLCQRHTLASHWISGFFHSDGQVLGDHLDGLQLIHVAHDPCTLGDIAFDGVGQGIHTRGCRQSLGQAVHQFGVNNGHGRDVVGIHTHHLGLTFLVNDDIVYRNLCSCAGCGGKGNDGHTLVLCGSASFQRDDVAKFRVVGHNADTLCRVHAGTAANGYDAVCSASLERFNALLHVGYCGVGLNLTVDIVGESHLVQYIGYHLCGSHLDETFVRCDKSLLDSHSGQYFRQLLAGAGAEVRNFVQNKSLCHKYNVLEGYLFDTCQLSVRKGVTGKLPSVCNVQVGLSAHP